MTADRLRLGQLVSSKAGRDCGQHYLVVGKSEDGFVFVCDGRRRGLANPKKKNVKHLLYHRERATDIERKLEAGEEVTDGEIRDKLAEFGR
ncbi:MAG: RNA-binding protein [Firmicutes bacterium]|nr:RNA-binding protein [Bacillota bacterium]